MTLGGNPNPDPNPNPYPHPDPNPSPSPNPNPNQVARLRVELEQLRAEMAATLEQLQRLTENAVEGLGLSPAKPSPRCLVLPDGEVPVPASPACASPVASPRPRRKAGRPSASPSERAPMTGDRALAHQLRVSRQASPTRAR